MRLPRAAPGRLAPDEGHAASVQPDPGQDPAGDHAAAQPLVERPALRRRPRAHDAAAASPRHDLRDHDRLRRSRPDRADRRRSHRSFELGGGLPVAEFDARLHALLGELGIDVEIREQPFGVPMTTPFPAGCEHASWDRDAIARFGRILDWSDSVFEEFSGWFNGKTSPVHLFWHSLDLAVTRFSGRPGAPMDADPVTQEAYSQRGHLVRVLGRRRQPRRRRLLLLHRPRARRPARPTAAGGRVDRVRLRLAGDPPLRDGAHGARPQTATLLAFCRAPTRPAPASPAGTPPASSRHGAPAPRSSTNSTPAPPPPSGARPRRGPRSSPGRAGSRHRRQPAAAGCRRHVAEQPTQSLEALRQICSVGKSEARRRQTQGERLHFSHPERLAGRLRERTSSSSSGAHLLQAKQTGHAGAPAVRIFPRPTSAAGGPLCCRSQSSLPGQATYHLPTAWRWRTARAQRQASRGGLTARPGRVAEGLRFGRLQDLREAAEGTRTLDLLHGKQNHKVQPQPRSACKSRPSVSPTAKISYPRFAVIQGGFSHSIPTEMTSGRPHVRSVSASILGVSDGGTERRSDSRLMIPLRVGSAARFEGAGGP